MIDYIEWPYPTRQSKESCLKIPAFELEADYALVADEASKNDGIHPLPGIFVNPPAIHPDGTIVGRERVDFYVPGMGLESDRTIREDLEEELDDSSNLNFCSGSERISEPDVLGTGPDGGNNYNQDPYGYDALDIGSQYYREAMRHQSPEEHDLRIECFKAAQMFYLHAASCGNVLAYCNLGYIYSYDRCEGDYWEVLVAGMSASGSDGDDADDANVTASNEPHKHHASFSPEKRAFECYRFAAEHEEPEACYKLGDMLSSGRGCDRNVGEAFSWYAKAFELGKELEPSIWGSAALRLASCYRDGRGCTQDLQKSLEWFEIAETGLQEAVDMGDWFYKKPLKSAKDGASFMRQELSGQY